VSVVAVVGPTASGKSRLAVGLAQRLGAEIVNADAMAVYRGMDVGTAKPPLAERGGVGHHLLDVLDPAETASVAEHQAWARAVLAGCDARGVPALVVGGSALYVRAVLDRFEFPGTDPDVRAALELELAERGAAALHRRLADVDPVSAAALAPSNGRRVVRALEVVTLTGRPFSATLPGYEYLRPDTVQIGLAVPRDVLDARIERRVHAMFEAGLVDEVRHLEPALRRGRTASRALGYAQVLDHLAGRITREEAVAATVLATRRFARRQDRWFRRDPRIRWLPFDAADLLDRAEALAREPSASIPS
jgi:tRNA dimethylallyltransferase